MLCTFPSVPNELGTAELKTQGRKLVLNAETHTGQSSQYQKYYILYQQDKKIKLNPIESFFMKKTAGVEAEQTENLYEHHSHKDKKQMLVDAFGTKKS